MGSLLEKAFAEVAKLSEDQQEAFAKWILEELEDEERWDTAFAQSADALSQLGAKALAEFRAGRTDELDLDDLE